MEELDQQLDKILAKYRDMCKQREKVQLVHPGFAFDVESVTKQEIRNLIGDGYE